MSDSRSAQHGNGAHLSQGQRLGYLQRTLPPDLLRQVDHHLDLCDSCREAVASHSEARMGFSALRHELATISAEDSEHLPYETLEAYVDGRISPMQLRKAETHLEECGPCVERLESLRALQEEMAARPTTELAGDRATWWRRLWPSKSGLVHGSGPARLAWASTAAAFILIIIVVLSQMQVGSLRSRLDTMVTESTRRESETARFRAQLAQLTDESVRLKQERQKDAVARQRLTQQKAELMRKLKATRQANAIAAPGSDLPLAKQPPEHIAALLKRDVLMSGSDGENRFRLLNPVGTAVTENRPTFRWTRVPEATRYRVSVSELRDVSHEVLTATVEKTEWTASRPLVPGRAYSWQVIPYQNSEEIPGALSSPVRALFLVLDRPTAEALQRRADESGTLLRRLAVQYANAGAFDRAEEILIGALSGHPLDLDARSLLAQVRRMRGRPAQPDRAR